MTDPSATTVPLPAAETPMEKLARTEQDVCADNWEDAAASRGRREERTSFLPGVVVGAYRIKQVLGWGGQGQVFLAVNRDTGDLVTLKTLRDKWRKCESVRRRFSREVLALAPLKHENIVRVLDAFEAFGRPFIVMEYVKGETLADAVIRRRHSNHELLEIFLTCCDTMAYAHDRGIIHLDLKPQNILLNEAGVPKITDFGIARNLCRDPRRQSNAHEPNMIGSPAYMAPEQAANRQQDLGPHTDVYALGVMLYHLLTGELPHLEDTPRQTIARILNHDPTPPIERDPFIGRELNAICMKALARAPQERYAGPGALAADLRRYRNGEPLEVRV